MSDSSAAAGAAPALFDAQLQISEIVLRTHRYEAVKAWYQTLFGGLQPSVETQTQGKLKSVPHILRLCFLRIHAAFPYTQVVGIFEMPEASAQPPAHTGLDHMQFRERTLENLFGRYAFLKRAGILPTQCFNHGPSTSFYYKDPDGNVVEISAVNFHEEKDYLAFFQSENFKANVEGHEVDPEDYMAEHGASVTVHQASDRAADVPA